MASMTSFYEILGIPSSASGREIKAAYRKLARICHPDVVSAYRKENSANEFVKIHAAYSTLSDPSKRAAYDRDVCCLRKGQLGYSSLSSAVMAATSSSVSGYRACKNWETDQCW